MKQFDESAVEYLKIEKKILELLEKLKSMGLELTENFRTKTCYGAVIPEIGNGFNKSKTGISYSRDQTFCSGFNGIYITEEMLLDEEKNPYEEDALQWNLIEKEILEEEKKIIEELSKKNKRLNWSIFNKKELSNEIEELKTKLIEVQKQKEEGFDKKRRYETFKNLTKEEKKALLEYFKLVKMIEKIGDKIKNGVQGCIEISTHYVTNKKKLFLLWEEAFGKIFEIDSDKTKKEVKHVDEILIDKIKSLKNFFVINDEVFDTGYENISPKDKEKYFAIIGYINLFLEKNKEKLIVESREKEEIDTKGRGK